MRKLYSPITNKGSKFFTTSRRGAELIKYASNAFLATKITFINELANLCEKSGVNIEDISLGMGSDSRIGGGFYVLAQLMVVHVFLRILKVLYQLQRNIK